MVGLGYILGLLLKQPTNRQRENHLMETVFVLQGYDIGGDTRILVFRYLEDAKREKFEMEKEFEFVDLEEMEVMD